MVFNDPNVFWGLLAVVSVWLVVLTVFLFRTAHHYNRLTAHSNGKTGLRSVIDRLLDAHDETAREHQAMESAVRDIRQQDVFHLQQIGVARYNPFSDTGGSQSFSVAILDGAGNGIVITSLYARTGNRWYLKEIVSGKGKEVELTKEEQLAIKKAKKTE